MGSIFDIINVPLGYLFRIIFQLIGSYGWALILFTIITKTLLLPLSVKQQKSMSKMQAIQPKLQEIQRKYQYDKEKLNQETMKIYQTHKINPMGGCLPILIQFPILIGLYNIIRSPLTYITQLGKHGLPTVQQVYDVLVPYGLSATANDQIKIADFMFHHAEQLKNAFPGVNLMPIDFTFWGLNLSQTPNFNELSPLILIPILAGLSTFLVSRLSMKLSGNNNQAAADNPTASSMQMMNYIFPFMTAFFAISLPAGLGFYWILSNIYQVGQQFLLTKYFSNKAELDEPKKEHFREKETRRRKK